MVLSDACMYRVSNHPLIKFEQGYLQKEFLFKLFSLFGGYCFMIEPGERIELHGERKGSIKSYWFKLFLMFTLILCGIYFMLLVQLVKTLKKVLTTG